MSRSRWMAVAAVILAAALARLLPHPPNVTPIAAMALFGGAFGAGLLPALLLPLAAMAASDVLMALIGHVDGGWHPTLPFVYASILATVVIGRLVGRRLTAFSIAGGAVAASLLFFVVTNFGTWLVGGIYPLTAEGLSACFVAALPFLRLTLLGDLFYSGLLFGGFALAERWLAGRMIFRT
jgi:hypothetical protein